MAVDAKTNPDGVPEPKASKASDKSIYNVLSSLLHDKKPYKKGSTIQLTKKEAAPLLHYKTIEPAK